MTSFFTFVGVIACFVMSWWFPRTVLSGVFWYFLGGWWCVLFCPAMIVGFIVDSSKD